jgi:fumarate reductase subunit D
VARSREPFFWVLFTGGGMLAALVLPALVVLLWLAIPLGWIEAPSHSELVAKTQPSLVRLALFIFLSFSLFHWAHRFRYTLYDGLQLEHLYGLIAIVCYGGATALTVLAAWVLWNF